MQALAAIEQQISAAGFALPKVSPEKIDSLVAGLTFHTHRVPGTTTTIAVAIDEIGIVVGLGTSASACLGNFNEVTGRNHAITRAKNDAREQLWQFEGYRLKRNLAEAARAGLVPHLEQYQGEADAVADPAFVADAAAGCCTAAARGQACAAPCQAAPLNGLGPS